MCGTRRRLRPRQLRGERNDLPDGASAASAEPARQTKITPPNAPIIPPLMQSQPCRIPFDGQGSCHQSEASAGGYYATFGDPDAMQDAFAPVGDIRLRSRQPEPAGSDNAAGGARTAGSRRQGGGHRGGCTAARTVPGAAVAAGHSLSRGRAIAWREHHTSRRGRGRGRGVAGGIAYALTSPIERGRAEGSRTEGGPRHTDPVRACPRCREARQSRGDTVPARATEIEVRCEMPQRARQEGRDQAVADNLPASDPPTTSGVVGPRIAHRGT